MGILKPCLSVTGDSVEIAVFELYDEAESINVSPTNPGFDDILGEPFLEDVSLNGIGERVRPSTQVSIKAKAKFAKFEEQNQDQTGNAPESFLTITIDRRYLEAAGLFAAGVIGIRPNDRLLRLQSSAGVVRVDFQNSGRDPVYVTEVRPGETGETAVTILLEKRRPVAR